MEDHSGSTTENVTINMLPFDSLEIQLEKAKLAYTLADVKALENHKANDAVVSMARADRYNAAAENLRFESQKLERDIAMGDIYLARLQREEKDILAYNRFNSTFVFTGEITGESVGEIIQAISNWSRQNAGADLEVIISSHGGSIIAGMGLFDFLRQLKDKGHKVTTKAMGMAASMAAVVLQAGSVRQMGREAWLLLHEGQFSAQGTPGEVEDVVKWTERLRARIANIMVERSAMTGDEIQRKWKRKDWWLDSTECLELGFIDEIV